MLTMISCDKFISHGMPRPAIEFHKGLNVILGDAAGSNSIGKTTFLMIVDFVLGGSDYLEGKMGELLSDDLVGQHLVKFSFEFKGKPSYFSKNTATPNVVNVCDENFDIKKEISLKEYLSWLASSYGLSAEKLSFREAVSPFIRVYGRDSTDAVAPMQADKKEKIKDQINRLLKLFGRFGAVDAQDQLFKTAADKVSKMSGSIGYGQMRAAANKTEYKENERRIKALQSQINALADQSNKGLADLDSEKAKRLAAIEGELSPLRRQKWKIYYQIKAIKNATEPSKTTKEDYEELRSFFKDVDLPRIEEIEAFHNKLAKILAEESKDSIKELQDALDAVNVQIHELEGKKLEISSISNVSEAVLKEYSDLEKEMEHLQEANKRFDDLAALKQEKSAEEEKYNKAVVEQTSELSQTVNEEMAKLNDYIYGGTKTSPILTVNDYKNYDLSVTRDGGTGSQYRGLILFDLAALKMTKLPIVVHDSIILKNLEDYALTKILELYDSTDKQVIIAFDKYDSYGPRAKELLESKSILRLSNNGDELFGKAFNETR